jgi:hypothetical protein
MKKWSTIPVFWLAVALAVALWPAPASAEPSDIAKLKAAYVVNFIRYTAWPAERFESDASPLVVTIVGEDEVGEVLRDVARKQGAGLPRRLVVQTVAYPAPERGKTEPTRDQIEAFAAQLLQSHLVYLPVSESDHVRPVLAALAGNDVLTVGDVPGFARRGGMLGLVRRENHIAFDANPDAIKKTRVTVSSKVLRLATIVKTEEN